ncbi:MAG: dienelactone hydrolase family protein [Planctomycetota bacterium]
MKITLLGVLAILAFAPGAEAEVKTKAVEYKHGDVVLEGWMAWDDAAKEKRPGVLVVHEWWGHNPYVRKRAEQLAAEGYVAFALDMYGKGVLETSMEGAGKRAGALKGDRRLMRDRALAGLGVLAKDEHVDAKKLAAIGYCFGGTVALELARDGVDLAAAVSFHGGLETSMPAEKGKVKAKVLVCHGADDGFVPAKEVAGFEEEMRRAGADWQLVKYSGAVHSFTSPEAGNDPAKGVAYNEAADKRSWRAMKSLFEEAFR